MIVIVNSNADKIELTVEQLKKYLEEARQEGYDEGYRIGSANVVRYPVYINDNWQKKNWWDYSVTWCNNPDNDVTTSCEHKYGK